MDENGIDFSAIPQLAVKVLTSPADFFRGMPRNGGFLHPLVFMVVLSVISGVLCGLLHALTNILGLRLYAGIAMGFLSIVMLPVLAAIGSTVFGFMAAGVLFVIWKGMGSNEDYEGAYRCTAYLAAVSPVTTVLTIIPYIGGAIGLLILLYYLVTATVAVHGIPSRKAWVGFGIITVLLMILSVSTQITERRFARTMEQAAESWKSASEQVMKDHKEMQSR